MKEINGNTVCKTIKEILHNNNISAKEKLEGIELAVEIYMEWNNQAFKYRH